MAQKTTHEKIGKDAPRTKAFSKPEANDRNIKVTQHISTSTLLGATVLHAFGNSIAACCDIVEMVGVVGSSLKMVEFFMQHLWMLHDVALV